MTNKDTEELPTEPEVVKLDLDKIQANLPAYSSEKLCEMIVCDRWLGINPQIGLMCMQELANRRIAGSDFPFEKYMEEAQAKLPPLNFNVPDLRTTLSQIIKAGQKS